MFVAHLPAGYLLTAAIQARAGDRSRAVLLAGLGASVAPDLDLLWFYLVDGRRVVHHAYVTHAPLFWVAVAAALWPLARRVPKGPLLFGVALASLMLHMALDTVAGGIRWPWSFSEQPWVLAEVPAVRGWWVWNFVLHWTFALELLILAAAGALLWRREGRAAGRGRPYGRARAASAPWWRQRGSVAGSRPWAAQRRAT